MDSLNNLYIHNLWLVAYVISLFRVLALGHFVIDSTVYIELASCGEESICCYAVNLAGRLGIQLLLRRFIGEE